MAVLALLALALARAEAACPEDAQGIPRVTCDIALVLGSPLCPAIDAGVQDRVARTLGRAATTLERAESARRPGARRRLVRRADGVLRTIGRQTRRAERRELIDGDCRTAIDGRVAALRDAVAVLLRDAGPTAPPGLPPYVAGYERWLRLNATPIPPRPSDPHDGTKDVFVNQTRDAIAPAGRQVFPYPDGAVVVKAAVRPGADFVGLVAVMRKRAGSDPAHGDWTFVEYARGSAAEPFRELARDGACWGCHATARATDWAFTVLE
jgi:hypothetical protein